MSKKVAKKIVVIDYGSGNLRSVSRAFEHVTNGDTTIQVSEDASALASATHIVLPGVGAFGDCMQGLTSRPGLLDALTHEVRTHHKPFLGICVGMQLLFESGHEHGTHPGLGWLSGDVHAITSLWDAPKPLKIPHMGWNTLTIRKPSHPLLQGITPDSDVYFVHSYAAQTRTGAEDTVLATVDYGSALPAIVGRGNIVGTQFHPEKSQETGLQLIKNFVMWDGHTENAA